MIEPKRNYSIAVDFDGVIHSYTSKWISADVIPDPPVPGAIKWLNEISRTFGIVIFTTRGKTHEGRWAVRKWLTLNGFRLHHDDYEVTVEKPPAIIYLDDRAVRFDGTNFPTVDQIRGFVPWNKKPASFSKTTPSSPVTRAWRERLRWLFSR